MLALIDQKRRELHELNVRIEDAPLSAAMDRMEKACLGILNEVEQHPGKGRAGAALCQLLSAGRGEDPHPLRRAGRKGRAGRERGRGAGRGCRNAQTIATAFENQLDSLFARDALDISTDLEVLNGMLKGQGLVDWTGQFHTIHAQRAQAAYRPKIFRGIFQKCSSSHQGLLALFGSSRKKFSGALHHLEWCGIAIKESPMV